MGLSSHLPASRDALWIRPCNGNHPKWTTFALLLTPSESGSWNTTTIMDTGTYASLAAISRSGDESNRHPAIPEIELIPQDLFYIGCQRTKSKSHALRGKVSTRLLELFAPPQSEKAMSGDSMCVIFTPTGPLVYTWQIYLWEGEINDRH
jgi:hypothetical protein